jgi:hypothetical protein
MNRIAKAAPAERKTIFEESAVRQKMSPVIMEKDFWVCWMLGQLFDRPEWGNSLVFKGGTSLSKVFNAIRRFSEDIDLSISPEVLGITTEDVENAVTRKQRDTLMNNIENRCCAWVQNVLLPDLEVSVAAVLGMRLESTPWLEYERDGYTHSPVLTFHYPSDVKNGYSYIRRSVKLEFGSLTDQQPRGTHRIRPWIADVLRGEMREMGCDVVALELERSFWEKATILHAEHHRDIGTPMPVRYSRHYSDLASLARAGLAEKAVSDGHLRQRVVDWKARFFASARAKYDLAKPDTFRLLPPRERMAELEHDYEQMREMFVEEPPPLPEIMAVLQALETQINQEK